MEAFRKRVLWHREHGIESLIKPPSTRTRKPRVKPPPVCCIMDCEEDEEQSSDPWDYSYF